MPQAIPLAVAAISSAYAATISTVAAVGIASLGEGAAVALASSVVNAGISATLGAAATALLAPKVSAAQGNPTDWQAAPDAPIPFAFGRVGAAGNIVHRETFGPDLMYQGFVTVLSGAGPIQSFSSFTGDDQAVTFDGSGKANSSQWSGEMWMKTSLGAQPSTALASPSGLKNGAALPAWGSGYGLSGKAAYMLVLGENSKRSAFPTGEPKPLWIIEGLKVWDPRQDSTYPGGSGSCRLSDPSTWVSRRNGPLFGLKWALGLWEGPIGQGVPGVDYQVGGIGAKIEGIDVAAFVDAANIADANSWTAAAYPTTDDDKAQVLDGFLQTAGCIYAQKAGKISCIQRAAPRTSIVTISAEDTAGPLEIDTAASRIYRINTLRPRFWSEANRWQMTAIDEVTATTYQAEDGGKRTRPLDFPFVPDATQCAQLAALQIANTREGITGVIPLKPHLQRITPGDAFTITEAGFVLNGLKCLCLNTDYDPATGVHRVTFVSETDAKYAFALGQSPNAPVSPTLTPVDPTYVAPPGAGDWTVTPRPPGTGGSLPVFDVTGIVDNATATGVIVEWGLTNDPTDAGNWKQAYEGPPTATNIPLVGIQPKQVYYVAVRYRRDSNYSARRIYGPYTAPDLVAGDVLTTGPNIAAQIARIDGLITTYGDTVASAANASAAQAAAAAGQSAKNAAEIAAGVAATERAAAQTAALASSGSASGVAGSASVATTKRDEASGFASAASASATAAQASNVGSNNAASSAATSASTATAKATEAGGYATTANAQRVLAETARGQAQTAATNAATSQTNAAGFASSASTAAGVSSSARDASVAARDAALGYRDTAGGHASSASGSASTATARASEAGTYASAAQADRIAAQAANTSAGIARDAAVAAQSGAAGLESAARTSATLAARVGIGGGTFINATPSFVGFVATGTSVSAGWRSWSHGEDYTVVEGQISDTALRWVVPAGRNTGIVTDGGNSGHYKGAAGPGWWVVESLVVVDGSLQGSGILFQAFNGTTHVGEDKIFHFATSPDSSGSAPGTGSFSNRTFSHSFLFRLNNPCNVFAMYSMPGWTGFGDIAGKTLQVHLCGVRRATAAEIETGIARASYPSVSARIAAEESTRASETTALANRATTTEAQLQIQPNIIPNSSFADGLRGWVPLVSFGSNWNIFTSSDAFGAHARTTQAASGYNGHEVACGNVFPNDVMTLSGEAYTAAQVPVNANTLRVYFVDGGGTYIQGSEHRVYGDPGVAWGKKFVTITTPSNAARAFVSVFGDNVTANGSGGDKTHGWRRLKLERGSTATPWTDERQAVDLLARTSITETSVADAQAKLAIARITLRAAASGSDPAYMEIVSGTHGSNIALVAQQIALASTVGGTVVPVLVLSAGRAQFTGNVDISGDLLVTGTVTTQKIADRNVTNTFSAYTESGINLEAYYSTIQSITVATTGKTLLLSLKCYAGLWHPSAGDAIMSLMLLRIDLNAGVETTIWTKDQGFIAGDYLSGSLAFDLEDRPTAGTYAYIWRGKVDVSNLSSKSMTSRSMRVVEIKTEA